MRGAGPRKWGKLGPAKKIAPGLQLCNSADHYHTLWQPLFDNFYILRQQAEMGARSWFRVPARPRSRYFRSAGARECKFYTGTRKNRNAKFAFLWRVDPKPASRQYTRTPHTCDEGGGVMARWQVDPASWSVHTHTARVWWVATPPPKHTLFDTGA